MNLVPHATPDVGLINTHSCFTMFTRVSPRATRQQPKLDCFRRELACQLLKSAFKIPLLSMNREHLWPWRSCLTTNQTWSSFAYTLIYMCICVCVTADWFFSRVTDPHSNTFIDKYREGASDVMTIIVGNGLENQSSNPRWVYLHFMYH